MAINQSDGGLLQPGQRRSLYLSGKEIEATAEWKV